MVIDSVVCLVLRDPDQLSSYPLMLQPILFSPVLKELAYALNRCGVKRFFVVCEPDLAAETAACLPPDALVLPASDSTLQERLCRFGEGSTGKVLTLTTAVWFSTAALSELLEDEFINPAGDALGVYRVEGSLLAQGGVDALNWGEFYSPSNDPEPRMIPLNTPSDLARIRPYALADTLCRLMETGVDVLDPNAVYVEAGAEVAPGTRLLPGTILQGAVTVGRNCVIGPNSLLADCVVEDGCMVNASQIRNTRLPAGSQIGPFVDVH